MATTLTALEPKAQAGAAKTTESLSITDNRTGKAYEVPIQDGTIRAIDLRQIKAQPTDFGLMTYDPAFLNTASCKSTITFIDGSRVSRTSGLPDPGARREDDAPETAYLVVNGSRPRSRSTTPGRTTSRSTRMHENLKKLMEGFRYDAHPMGMLLSTVGALSTFYPDAKKVFEKKTRDHHITRLIAKMPTIAAFAYRHSIGFPYVYPDNDLSYTGNFLSMMKKMAEPSYKVSPVLERALDVLFILHADHEQNCSTNAMRSVGSAQTDPYSSVAAATAALYGPLHGGANEAVLRMLNEIGDIKNVPAFVKDVKEGHGEKRLMGFGHRVYKNYDPRAQVIKKLADEVFEVTGKNPLLAIAVEMERIALQDDYFIKRKLYPNVDFYSGLIYEAMGFHKDFFTVLFAIPRTAGWLAQWQELVEDPEQKIARPRQIFTGAARRDYKPIDQR